ncbi:anthranilate synthase component I [Serratia fonticola]|uniref:Anthranilate synthase component I n=1 Tax=Serratia fonticola TaxID=47917 RepID=A0A4U9WJ12_SERFO|nr:anthranilate synthase component I [Serratia fonticola]
MLSAAPLPLLSLIMLVKTGLTVFKNLLLQESGAYWTFFIKCQDVTLIGASPERHITLQQQRVSMTPISGTYRYPPTGANP